MRKERKETIEQALYWNTRLLEILLDICEGQATKPGYSQWLHYVRMIQSRIEENKQFFEDGEYAKRVARL